MKYLYPGELKHQIFEFARDYGWIKKPTKRTFSEDFIISQLSLDRKTIPSETLRTVMKVTDEIVPDDKFVG